MTRDKATGQLPVTNDEDEPKGPPRAAAPEPKDRPEDAGQPGAERHRFRDWALI